MAYVTTTYARDPASGQLLFTAQGYLLPIGAPNTATGPRIGEVNYIRNGSTGEILFDSNGYPIVDQAWFYNDGAVLAFTNAGEASGWPISPVGLPAGSFWNNGLTVGVVPGVVPNPSAVPVYFGSISAPALLVLGGGNLPLSPGAFNVLWNCGGMVAISA